MIEPTRENGRVVHFSKPIRAKQLVEEAKRRADEAEAKRDDEYTTSLVASGAAGDHDLEVSKDEQEVLIDRAIYCLVDRGLSFDQTREKLGVDEHQWVVLRNSFRFASRHGRAVSVKTNDGLMRAIDGLVKRIPMMTDSDAIQAVKGIVGPLARELGRFEVQMVKSKTSKEPQSAGPDPELLARARKNRLSQASPKEITSGGDLHSQ